MRLKFTSSGFSVAEVVVVSAMFGILITAVTSTIVTFYQVNSYTLAQAQEVHHARRGVERLVRDIREMTFSDDGTYPLVSMATNSLAFYSDIDRDNSVEYVRYVLATTTLYKYVYNATGTPLVYSSTPDETYTISEYVRNITQATSTFRYYMDNNVPASATSTITDIRYIGVYLVVNVDPTRTPGEFMIHSSAAPRNLKTSF